MKKRFLLFTAIAGFAYVTLSSSLIGGAKGQGSDGTKASGATNTCGRLGCHPGTTTTTVTLELDSLGFATTRYVAGLPASTYTIKITGTNTSSSSLPKFGFQVTVVKSSGAGTSSAVLAGTLPSTGLPASVQMTPKTTSALPFDVIEHSAPLAATTGTGGSGTTYVVSVPWTAPATAGTGAVVIYGCINAVNNDLAVSGDAYNSAAPLTITEKIPLAVASISGKLEIKAFPNPATSNLSLELSNAQAGNYSLQVYNLGGKLVAAENINVNNNSQTINLNSANWPAGTYMVSVEKDGNRQVIPVVKQ